MPRQSELKQHSSTSNDMASSFVRGTLREAAVLIFVVIAVSNVVIPADLGGGRLDKNGTAYVGFLPGAMWARSEAWSIGSTTVMIVPLPGPRE